MQNVLKALHTEHANILRVLDFLESQVGLLEAGGNPQWDLMGDVMHYLTNFPDLYHHPKEDLIFQRLRIRQKEAGTETDVDSVMEEHKELAVMGQKFRAAIAEVDCGSVMTVEDFAVMARTYCEVQRKHIELEEQVLFPLAVNYLRQSDWSEVDAAVDAQPDPIFGAMIKDEYRMIRSALSQ